MQEAAQADAHNMYGFMWWLPIPPDSAAKSLGPVYVASGWGGQYIIIIPKRDIVLVITGGNYEGSGPGTVSILSYLLDAFFVSH